MASSRLSRPGWKVLGGLLLAALAWFGVPRLLGGLEFFQLRKIEVQGLVYLQADEVARALPVREGQSIFDDLDPVARAADSLPGVVRAVVRRRLPGTLVVRVEEAAPVAQVMRRGRLALVGAGGQVLPFDPTVAAPDLPLVREADSLVTGLLARIRLVDPTFFAGLVSGWRAGEDVVLADDERRYWFRPGASAEVIRAVTAVAADLAARKRRWTELDARFAGQVVVRGAA